MGAAWCVGAWAARITVERNQPGWLTGLMILTLVYGAISIYQIWKLFLGDATVDKLPLRTTSRVLSWIVVAGFLASLAL